MSWQFRAFHVMCGLTCDGGSERRQCACTTSDECLLQDNPHFAYYRVLASKRYAKRLAELQLLGEDDSDPLPTPYFDEDDPNAPT